ncbi:MAG: histidinol dehydrogenase, partial [Bacteroidetes bacterium]|nr:histidinol dehydrogenase [Bacteroidota bacterium]
MLVFEYPERSQWPELLRRPVFDNTALETSVGNILADVRQNGDAAVRKYAQQFDKVQLDALAVTPAEFAQA